MAQHNLPGNTDLIGRSGVSKADKRIEAIGAIDEAAAAIAHARASLKDSELNAKLRACQAELSMIMGYLASTDVNRYGGTEKRMRIQEALERLLGTIDELQNRIPSPKSFIVPGDEPVSAALDLARTVVRRAERRVVDLYTEQGTVDPLIAEYLNKLSTLVYLIELSVILPEG